MIKREKFEVKVLFIVCAIVVLMIPAMARSTTIQFNINAFLTGATPTSTPPWLTLTFTDTTPGTVQFTVASSLEVASEFIGEIVFNVNPLITPSSVIFGSVSQSGTFTLPTISQTTQDAQSLPPADNFDIRLEFANPPSGRFNGSDSITWDLTCSGDPECAGFNATSFNFFNTENQPEFSEVYTVAHFQGIPAGVGSGKWGDNTPGDNIVSVGVPEPATMLLLGSGLLGLIGLRRKFRT